MLPIDWYYLSVAVGQCTGRPLCLWRKVSFQDVAGGRQMNSHMFVRPITKLLKGLAPHAVFPGSMPEILIWTEVTRWRNTGQGKRDTCSASLLIRPISEEWCSSHSSYHTIRNQNLYIIIATEGWNLGSCLVLCSTTPRTSWKYSLQVL